MPKGVYVCAVLKAPPAPCERIVRPDERSSKSCCVDIDRKPHFGSALRSYCDISFAQIKG